MNKKRKINKLIPLMITAVTLIGCSEVNEVKPKFSKYENEISYTEFTGFFITNNISKQVENKLPMNEEGNLNKGLVLSINQSKTQTLSGKNSVGGDALYKSGQSYTSTFTYDQKNQAGLHESKEVREITAEAISGIEIDYEDGFYLDLEEQSSLEMENKVSTHGLIRTQYKDDVIYIIDQINKEYEEESLGSYSTFDKYISNSVINNFSVMPTIILATLAIEVGLDISYYSDKDNKLLTATSEAKGTLTTDELTSEYNVSLTCQLDITNCTFGYAKTVNIKQKAGNENIKYVENTYYSCKLEFKNNSVVQTNVDNFNHV